MPIRIRDQALREALADLAARLPEEGCGAFIGAESDRIDRYVPIRNIAPQPNRRFEADPREWIRLLYDCERDRHAILGFIHSHPGSEAIPSPKDAAGWLYDFPSYWIAARSEDGRWIVRAYEGSPAVSRPLDYSVIP